MKKLRPLVTVLIALSFWVAVPALAQTAAPNPPATPNPTTAAQNPTPTNNSPGQPPTAPGTINCFDYYHFQSVQINFETNQGPYKPGTAVHFQGSLINQNDYPIANGYVFARVSRKDPHYLTEGNYIVDEFVPFSDVNLGAKEKKNLSFDWTVPAGATNGDYQIDFFFSVGKKYNISGLPFTNEVVGSQTWFTVASNNNSYVSFSRSKTTVNGQAYNQIGQWPLIAPNARVVIVQPLDNTYSTPQQAVIQYDLYFWDSLNPSDKISSKTEQVTLPANGSVNLAYTVPQMKGSVYLLKITATTPDQTSIINVRLTSVQDHPILNFPAITKFPLQKGDQETIFSCFEDSAPVDSSGQVSVILEDKTGHQIGQMSYDGNISGNMLAQKSDFTAQKNYTWLKLIATIKNKDGQVTDRYETVYDCAKMDSPACKTLLAAANTKATNGFSGQKPEETLVGLIAVLLVLSLAIIFRKKSRGGVKLLVFLVIGGSWLVAAPKTRANYDQQSPVALSYISNYNLPDHTNYGSWMAANASASNAVGIASNTVSQVNGNYYATAGNPINFSYDALPPYFFNYSTWNSSPYGAWCPNLNSPCGGYQLGSYVQTGDNAAFDVFTVTAQEPNVYITSSNPAVISCNGLSCTAQNISAPQTVTLTAHIPAFSATFWIRQYQAPYVNYSWVSSSLSYSVQGNTVCQNSCSVISCNTTCSTWSPTAARSYTFPAAPSSPQWTITVNPVPAPTVNLTVSSNGGSYGSSTTVAANQTATLKWTTTNATACWPCSGPASTGKCSTTTYDPNFGSANGSLYLYPTSANSTNYTSTEKLTQSMDYSIECFNSAGGGSKWSNATINVAPPPIYFCQSPCLSSDCGVTRQEACWEDNNGTLSSVSQSNCDSGTGCPTETCNAGCSVTNNNDWKEVAP